MTAKRAVFTVIAAAVAMITCVVWLTPSQTQPVTDAPEPTAQTEPQPFRVVGVWEGQVAVFLPQAETPEIVYDTRLSSLPKEEWDKLKAGIEVSDNEALRRLLEDYLS